MTSPPDTRVPPLDSIPDSRGRWIPPYASEPEATSTFPRSNARHVALGMVVGAIVAVGFLIRLLAAFQLSSHVDEPSSILAAHAVSERGWPILPSGTVYFQGATLSYLLLPFTWLGFAELEHLVAMRLVLVVAGTVAIYLCYRFGSSLTGEPRVGALAALLVAIDPISVQWSAHVRMYALLQTLTIGLAWAFIRLLTNGASWRRCLIVVALCWAAVFTHAGGSILVLALGVATIRYRPSLLRQARIVGTLVLCGLAPVTLIGLNQRLGTASVSTQSEASAPTLTFVGDNLLRPFARFGVAPTDWDWAAVIRPDTLAWLIPGLVVAASTIIGGRLLLRGDQAGTSSDMRAAVITLQSFYWVTVAVVGLLTVSPKERYVLHVHSIGYIFVAVVLVHLMQRQSGWRARRWAGIQSAGGKLVVGAVVIAIGTGLVWRLDERVVHPDYIAAMEYVDTHHLVGQPVIVALPAVGYLALGSEDLYFLAGSQDRPRAQRYTRRTDDDQLIDYWISVKSIVTADGLRRFLEEHPDAWVVVDQDRLDADWAYAGDIDLVLDDMTSTVFRAPGGALVLRPLPLTRAMVSG